MTNMVFIVTKESLYNVIIDKQGTVLNLPFKSNESVFESEDDAHNYINQRLSTHDRDDKNCKFSIEPWHIL